jgi:hypothetical protein
MLEKLRSGWTKVEHEKHLDCPDLRFRGTPDMVATHWKYGRTLIDFKTCKSRKSDGSLNTLKAPEDKHLCQVMTYSYIYEVVTGIQIDTVCIAYFGKDTSQFQEFYLTRSNNQELFQKAVDNYTQVLQVLNTIDPPLPLVSNNLNIS